MKVKNETKGTKSAKLKPTPVPQVEEVINTKVLAAICGTTPKALRRRLRARWYNDGVHTEYGWKPGDKVLNEILASYGKGPMEGTKRAKGKKGKKVEVDTPEVVEEVATA